MTFSTQQTKRERERKSATHFRNVLQFSIAAKKYEEPAHRFRSIENLSMKSKKKAFALLSWQPRAMQRTNGTAESHLFNGKERQSC